ncbi:MAG: asparagine synthase (glutamine-hydrolyzing) [Bacteroidota bacterium]
MCGITGLYIENKQDYQELQRSIHEMTSRLHHRGPDEDGYYVHDNIALGHRRLSIIDLKTGQQPIFNENKRLCIIYNGEVFNYQDIRAHLIQLGHHFSTNSDTETILHAFEEWGEGCLSKLRGMFAFAIWDSQKETLFLARDRLGIKPLFFAQYKGKFAFSSEMKSILVDPHFDRTMDEEALSSFFTFAYIPAPLTIYKHIRKLLPGHCLTYKNGQVTIKQYWDVFFQPDRQKKEKDIIAEFMELLRESVRIRLMSEVPLGAFLSGGIDSSTVVALMSQASRDPVKTFSIGFGGDTGGFDDERKYARQVAQRYGTNHTEHEVMPDVENILEKLVTSFDEPFADDSTIPTYFVCKIARENVTVALSGLGGDEMFCGYERYLGFQVSQNYNKIPEIIREKIIRRLIESMPESSSGNYTVNHMKRFVRSSSSNHAKKYFGFVSKINNKYKNSFFSEKGNHYAEAFDSVEKRFTDIFNSANADDPLNKVFYCDIKTYLPEDILACTDRLSMHHSLEVRVPFLDHVLVEYCATIPPEMKIKWFKKKYLLKKAVSDFLPKSVINHQKQGFVGPMTRWLQTNLKELTLNRLSKNSLKKHDFFNDKTIEKILSEHYSGREINDTLIWSLLIFQTWFDLYME